MQTVLSASDSIATLSQGHLVPLCHFLGEIYFV